MAVDKNGKKKILIVEDTDVIADCLADILNKYGTVDILNNGQTALIKVSLNHYDVIVSDVKMPGMNGIEFYRLAVETDSNLKNRFIFLTSSFANDHLNFFIDNDVPFLFKPASVEDVDSAVEEILNKQNAIKSAINDGKESEGCNK